MVFNKGSRISNSKFYIKDIEIESVRVYKYLGVLFSINGSFTNALSDMFCRGQKAFLSSLVFLKICLVMLKSLCMYLIIL